MVWRDGTAKIGLSFRHRIYTGTLMFLIVGLGNPGVEYENTRHNAGFMAIEELARNLSVSELKQKKKCHALIAEHKIILAQPQTYMNLSGQAVSSLLQWYKISIEKLIVVYDDVDLEPGQLRVKRGGGSGGHHGIESVIGQTEDSSFIRVRIGIGKGPTPGDVTNYVLGKIPSGQKEILNETISRAAEAVSLIISKGLDLAMN